MHVRGLTFPLATYRARRAEAARLAARHAFAPVPVLLVGCDEHRLRTDRQDPWFDYYTGCQEPDAAVLIRPDGHSTLFLDPGDPARVVWDGPRLVPGPATARRFGVDACRPLEALEEAVRAAAAAGDGRVGMCHRTREPGFQAQAFARWKTTLAPAATVFSVEPALVRQRMIKTAEEVACHREAIRRTAEGLRRWLPRIPTIGNEAELAAGLTGHYRSYDYGPIAFPPICGGGVNAATLHYPHNDRPLKGARCVLIDSGATAGGYCADVTRTVPRSGRFTDRRFRELYDLVLEANALGRANARPGMSRNRLNEIAWKPIIDAGHTRHHGLWHHIGMDVHDPADYDEVLAPGMIISNEPGIYLPDEGIGIRIEDDLLITAGGCEELTAAIPKDRAGIEAWMRG
jgi:Xaa-Pro aminopeptidase